MPLLDGEQLIRAHLDGNPDAHRAALHDPQFAAELHRLRTILGHLDTTLLTEGAGDEQGTGSRRASWPWPSTR